MTNNLGVRIGAAMFLTATGCGLLRPGPDTIAQRFWDASLDGDYERATEYVTSSSRGLLERNADAAPDFDRVDLGAVAVDGDKATVATQIMARINERPTEVEFDTVLEREDGQWRVNLRETTGQMLTQFIGQTAGEWMGQIGEAVGEQMRGMFDGLLEGLAEGMDEAARSLREARPDTTR